VAFRPATSGSFQLLRVRRYDMRVCTFYFTGRRAVWAGALWSARCLPFSTAFSPDTSSLSFSTAVSGNAQFGAREPGDDRSGAGSAVVTAAPHFR